MKDDDNDNNNDNHHHHDDEDSNKNDNNVAVVEEDVVVQRQEGGVVGMDETTTSVDGDDGHDGHDDQQEQEPKEPPKEPFTSASTTNNNIPLVAARATVAAAALVPGAVAVHGPLAAFTTQGPGHSNRNDEKVASHSSSMERQGENREASTAKIASTAAAAVDTTISANVDMGSSIQQDADADAAAADGTLSSGSSHGRHEDVPEAPPSQTNQQQECTATTAINAASDEQHHTNHYDNLPVAQEHQDIPLIEAEIVPPPPQTTTTAVPVLFHVEIDAENNHHHHFYDPEQPTTTTNPHRHNNNMHHQQQQQEEDKDNNICRRHCGVRVNHRMGLVLLLLLILLVVAAVVVALVFTVVDREESPSTTITASDNDDVATSFPYFCYTSTLDMLTTQIEAMQKNEVITEPFIICPNTAIQVGTFLNPARNDFNFTDGDYSIVVLRPNITIQCGLEGRHQDNCTLVGGLSHVVTQHASYHPLYGFINTEASTDYLTIKGMTFTGQFASSGPFGGISVALSHPGKGMLFEDCVWSDLTATKRVLTVGRNFVMELLGLPVPDNSMELTLRNCRFENVGYEEEFLATFSQSIVLENTTFSNVQLSSLLSPGCGLHPNGCRNVLHCQGTSVCSMSDICIDNFDATGAAPIVISHETNWTSHGTNTWIGPLEYNMTTTITNNNSSLANSIPQYEGAGGDDDSNLWNETITTTTTTWDDNPYPYCALGVARVDANGRTYTCLDPPVFTTNPPPTTGKCP